LFLDPFQLLLILGIIAIILVVIPTILLFIVKAVRASIRFAVRDELERRAKNNPP